MADTYYYIPEKIVQPSTPFRSEEEIVAEMTDLDTEITMVEQQIESLKALLKEKQDRRAKTLKEKWQTRDHVFEQTHNIEAEKVRKAYVSRLQKMCGVCGVGHYVKYRGAKWGNVIAPGSSHIYLLPRNHDAAQLTSLEVEAFECHDTQVWIDPKSHREIWGN